MEIYNGSEGQPVAIVDPSNNLLRASEMHAYLNEVQVAPMTLTLEEINTFLLVEHQFEVTGSLGTQVYELTESDKSSIDNAIAAFDDEPVIEIEGKEDVSQGALKALEIRLKTYKYLVPGKGMVSIGDDAVAAIEEGVDSYRGWKIDVLEKLDGGEIYKCEELYPQFDIFLSFNGLEVGHINRITLESGGYKFFLGIQGFKVDGRYLDESSPDELQFRLDSGFSRGEWK